MFTFAKQTYLKPLDQLSLHFPLGSGSPLFRPWSAPLLALRALPLELGAPARGQCSASHVIGAIAPRVAWHIYCELNTLKLSWPSRVRTATAVSRIQPAPGRPSSWLAPSLGFIPSFPSTFSSFHDLRKPCAAEDGSAAIYWGHS